MGIGEIIASLIHGVFAGGFGGVAIKKNNPGAGSRQRMGCGKLGGVSA